MQTPFVYQCRDCSKQFSRDEVTYLCPDCGQSYRPGIPLKGVLQAVFDYEYIRKKFKIKKPDWNLFSAVEPKYFPPYPLAPTPFFKALRLGFEFGLSDVWIKNDGLCPSGSLKDRASFLMAAEANRLDEHTIVTASTGNAASALAAVCAAAAKQAVIFAPSTAPKAKLLQMILYGAKLIPVKGTYDDAFRLSLEYTQTRKGLNRNTAYHPLTIEGKKTAGLEIFSQNGFRVPGKIVVPTGDGVIISGIYKAFYDLKMAGLTENMPQLICVQAESSDAIHRYITTGSYADAVKPATVADSISVTTPSNAHMARQAVLDTGGFSVTVTDEEILEGQKLLAHTTGIFAEPSCSATVAAIKKISESGLIDSRQQVVLLITGHGLKDIDTPLKTVKIPDAVEPDLNALPATI